MKGVKVGLEVHIQLNTDSKMFCGCKTRATKPNSATCEICLGMPGSKPVVNKKAIEFGIKLALALGCKFERNMFFSRKTYFYPDLSKNYQITQYEKPLGWGGVVEVLGKPIQIKRIHLEEDPAGLKHPDGILHSDYVLADYNRSGIPLVELVTEPVITSAKEARLFLEELFAILEYLQIFDPTKDTMKVDTNVSIPHHPRVEIKNIGSIRDVEKAISFELIRQRNNLNMKFKPKEETRSWTGSGTEMLRVKETEEEYGYIFDPDLPDIFLTPRWIKKIKASMPELPREKLQRFRKKYKLNQEIARSLILEKDLADDFEKVAKRVNPKFTSNWMSKYLKKVLHFNNIRYNQSKISSKELVTLFTMIQRGETSPRAGELLLRVLVKRPENPRKLAKRKNLLQLSSRDLPRIVDKVLRANRKAVGDYKAGEKKVLQYLVGEVIRATKGRADAKTVIKLLRQKIT